MKRIALNQVGDKTPESTPTELRHYRSQGSSPTGSLLGELGLGFYSASTTTSSHIWYYLYLGKPGDNGGTPESFISAVFGIDISHMYRHSRQ